MVVSLGAVSLAATGCPGSDGTGSEGFSDDPAAVTTTTTRPSNQAPVIAVDSFVWPVGQRLDARLSVSDPDGSVTGIAWLRQPPGFAAAGGANPGFSWTPPVAGTWRAEVTATDDKGTTTTATVTFVSRHPHRQHTLVGLGDSVAAGFGLDLTDALLGDPCWRAPGSAYPARVMDRLVAAGDVPRGEARVVLAACAGAFTSGVWESPTWPPPGAPEGLGEPGWSQLDWAIHLNPGYVTLTVGANDVGVADLSILAGGELDRAELDQRLEAVAGRLGYLLDELVDRTDARIVLTNYYNPTAANPRGLRGCRGQCFVELTDIVHDALNDTLARAATRHASRVRLADVAPLFEGHEAGDALGPGWLRKPIETFLGVQVRAYCSTEDPPGSWISPLDCVHPTGDGMAAIAERVASALSASQG
ncbi:MAG: GDSL-type esterase/lipase family protein [bacterium]|nr:GDSL-type esterase/lipase family protein [bacterium]